MPSRAQPRCSIVVRCYNEERHIGRLLHGIMAQDRRDVEVIVVDSGSTDRTLEVVGGFPVRLLHISPREFSFGRSLNLGCAAAEGEFVVAVSAHCYPIYTDWLERLLEPFADPAVAVAYGRQQGASTTRFSEHRLFATWFPAESDRDQKHPFCNNANAAVRRSVWQRLGYDETLTGLEDVAFAKAAMAEGHRVAYVAEAPVVHVHDETWRQIFNRYQREAIAFRRIFPEERFALGDLVRLLGGNLLADLRVAFGEQHLTHSLPGIAMFRLMQFSGIYRGLNRTRAVSSDLRRRFYYPSHRPHRMPRHAPRGSVVDYGGEPGTSG